MTWNARDNTAQLKLYFFIATQIAQVDQSTLLKWARWFGQSGKE